MTGLLAAMGTRQCRATTVAAGAPTACPGCWWCWGGLMSGRRHMLFFWADVCVCCVVRGEGKDVCSTINKKQDDRACVVTPNSIPQEPQNETRRVKTFLRESSGFGGSLGAQPMCAERARAPGGDFSPRARQSLPLFQEPKRYRASIGPGGRIKPSDGAAARLR